MELTLQLFGEKLGTININGDFLVISDKKEKNTQILQNKLGRSWEKMASWGEVGKKLGTSWGEVGEILAILLLYKSEDRYEFCMKRRLSG